MNHRILQGIWKPLSKTKLGRFAAGAIIGALFAGLAAAQQAAGLSSVALWALGGAVIGLLAVGILTAIDSERSRGANRDSRRQGRPVATPLPGTRSVPPPIPSPGREYSEANK